MTQTELRERTANGEHSGVEFTSDVIEEGRLAKELVAFANLRGGFVLLGMARLFQQRGTFRPELRPVSGTSMAALDRRRLEDYFRQVRQQDAPPSGPSDEWRAETAAWARKQDDKHWRSLVDNKEQAWRAAREAEWVSLLVNTEFLHDNDRQPATVAGLLLFGREPTRNLPQAKILN